MEFKITIQNRANVLPEYAVSPTKFFFANLKERECLRPYIRHKDPFM